MARQNRSKLNPALFEALVRLIAELTGTDPRYIRHELFARSIECLKDFVKTVYLVKRRDHIT